MVLRCVASVELHIRCQVQDLVHEVVFVLNDARTPAPGSAPALIHRCSARDLSHNVQRSTSNVQRRVLNKLTRPPTMRLVHFYYVLLPFEVHRTANNLPSPLKVIRIVHSI